MRRAGGACEPYFGERTHNVTFCFSRITCVGAVRPARTPAKTQRPPRIPWKPPQRLTSERSEFYSGQAEATRRNHDTRRMRSSGRVACVPAPERGGKYRVSAIGANTARVVERLE